MNAAQVQNVLVLMLLLGFATMEYLSRRYKATVTANSNDTKLELLMFLSLLAITQPLAILVSGKLGAAFFPELKDSLAHLPWDAMVGL